MFEKQISRWIVADVTDLENQFITKIRKNLVAR